jgi:hypothetical protein
LGVREPGGGFAHSHRDAAPLGRRETFLLEYAMQRLKWMAPIAVIILVGGWYLFRPERLFVSTRVEEDFPTGGAAGEPVAVLSGAFHSNAHETSGTATVYRLSDGRLVLRLTDLASSNGPDLRVYLVAAPDVHDEGTVSRAGFVDLGALKGNIGDQNYDLPPDIDLTRYRAVSIWCRRFSVNFGAAPLS